MNPLHWLRRLVEEPPPAYAFEISEAGLAWATPEPFHTGFQPFMNPALQVTPLKDNVIDAGEIQAAVSRVVNPSIKRKTCALILPDYCGRITLLDFDTFPSKPEEQLALVKFRVKKSVPYDIDSAAVTYAVQSHVGRKHEVVALVVSLEIVQRYEAPFRAAGLHPGLVTTASITSLDLVRQPGVSVAVRLAGRQLAVSVIDGGALKLVRCVELPDLTPEEVEGVLVPTLAYVEDELKQKPERLITCGFGSMMQEWNWQPDFGFAIEPLRSRFGTPGETNAGLYGWVEGTLHRVPSLGVAA
jgi:type IV pilus assembly protein PilM